MRVIPDSEKDAPIELVGGKAQGLFTLKSLESKLNNTWMSSSSEVSVPPSFVVPANMNLSDGYLHILEEARKIGDLYAVRSSSRLEDNGDNSFDGIFETKLNVPLDGLVGTIRKIRMSATSQRARQYAKEVGVKLEESMPVIVQQMVTKQDENGVVYSKFPCPRDIVKIIRDECFKHGRRLINAFLRETREDGTHYLNPHDPIIVSSSWSDYTRPVIGALGDVALTIEDEIGHPIIMEFSLCYDSKSTINPLQARRLTKISEALKFSTPQLQDKGLIGSTYDLNGTGDFTGKAFVARMAYVTGNVYTEGLEEFDRNHPEGYVFVTPFLEFNDFCLDGRTPNKKAVVAYNELGKHHDMEISRKKGILYLNSHDSLNMRFFVGHDKGERLPIETGETVRVASDGEQGFVFNLSRE